MSDIADRVKEIVAKQLGADDEAITPEATFVEDLGADSLDIVELVMALEEEFGLEIPDDAAEEIKTVDSAVKYIETKYVEYNFYHTHPNPSFPFNISSVSSWSSFHHSYFILPICLFCKPILNCIS